MNTILFYESDSKRARETAQKIAEELPKDSYKILPARDMNVDCLKEGDLFLFGLSSCGDDNGRNAEWTRVADLLKGCDLHGKKFGIFGYGKRPDGNYLCGHAGTLYDVLLQTGATPAEQIDDTTEYTKKFPGVVIDDADNGETSVNMVKQWTRMLNNNPNSIPVDAEA